MKLLRFRDSKGREWEVWEVGVRELPADVRARHHEFGRLPERWLCFESATERRRLAPYPQHWDAMSTSELDALCRTAVASRPDRAAFSPAPARSVDAEMAEPID